MDTEKNESTIKLCIELPTTSGLFKKHFNDMGQAGLFQKNTESFFEELNQVCCIEDAIKKINLNSNGH